MKSLRILLISLVFSLFILTSNCFAVNIDMNLTNPADGNLESDISSNIASNEEIEELNNSEIGNTNSNKNNTSANGSTQGESSSNRDSSITDTMSALPESELGLTNILNILLIAVGLVLILLAVAIFIKLKK